MKKVLIINGSFRKNSFNGQLAKEIEKLISDKVQVSQLEYADVPLYNQDEELPAPESVERVRKEVLSADGIWIVTPEYNYHIPGVLKNLLDWLSRPIIPKDWKTGSAVKNKPVAISGVAGKSAAKGARENLKSILGFISMNVIGDIGTGISLTSDAYRADVLNLSDEDKDKLKAQAEEFLARI